MRNFNIDATATTSAKTYALRVYDATSGEACCYTGLTHKQCAKLGAPLKDVPGLVIQVQRGQTDVTRYDTRVKPSPVRRIGKVVATGSLAGLTHSQRVARMAAAKALATHPVAA